MEYGYVWSNNGVTVHGFDGRTYTWHVDHPKFHEIKEMINDNRPLDDIVSVADLTAPLVQALAALTFGNVEVQRGAVKVDGRVIETVLADRIIEHFDAGISVDPLINFARRLAENPRFRAARCVYEYLEHNAVPILPNGCFLTYKKVRSDYMDCHTGTIRNRPGDSPSMNPGDVDDNPDIECGKGLHVCGPNYLPNFGGAVVVICEVDPACVVSVPRDYRFAKMRVHRYKVVGELKDQSRAHQVANHKIVEPGIDDIEGVSWHEPDFDETYPD